MIKVNSKEYRREIWKIFLFAIISIIFILIITLSLFFYLTYNSSTALGQKHIK